MTSSAKTLRALERAVMAYWRYAIDTDCIEIDSEKVAAMDAKINRACAAHAAALKRKRTGRSGR